MERRLIAAGSGSLAVIIRQFSPSRIERELLTRTFDVVVASPVHRGDLSSSLLGGENQHGVGSAEVASQTKPTWTRSVA